MKPAVRAAVVLSALSIPATSALALNILLCNDDGVTAANACALKQRRAAVGRQMGATHDAAAPLTSIGLAPLPCLSRSHRGVGEVAEQAIDAEVEELPVLPARIAAVAVGQTPRLAAEGPGVQQQPALLDRAPATGWPRRRNRFR